MQQLCYASQSNSTKMNLLKDLTNIHTEARTFNLSKNINGVLYFADGYFFQCLEGSADSLELLIDKLYKDDRHHNIKLFETQDIEFRRFSDWSMKYISKRSEIQNFCKSMGFNEFRPHDFEQHHVKLFIEELVRHEANAA